MDWLENQIFSIRDVKKIILLTSLLANPDLVEECGLPKSQMKKIKAIVIDSLKKKIDEFFEDLKNEEESILEIMLNK